MSFRGVDGEGGKGMEDPLTLEGGEGLSSAPGERGDLEDNHGM